MSLSVRANSFLFSASLVFFLIKFAEKIQVDVKDISGKLELIGLFLLVMVSGKRLLALPRELKIFLFLFGVSMLFGFGSGRAITAYGIGQLVLNLKFPLALLVGYALANQALFSERWNRFLIYAAILGVPFVIFELIASGVYRAIFPATLMDTVIAGTNIQRATGWFIHPSPFGIFCSVSVLYIVIAGHYLGWTLKRRIGAISALICLLASGQRQESLAVMLVLFGGYLVANRRRPLPILLTVLAVFLVVVFGFDFFQEIYLKTSANLSLDLTTNEMAPRLLLLRGAAILANQFFPYGSGLGTYGGSMAAVNPDNVYDLAEISGVWWFGQASFTTDTYWAMPYGELGWIGGTLLLIAHFYLLIAIKQRMAFAQSKFEKMQMHLAFGLLVFALLDSVGAPIYTGSTLSLLLIAVPTGYAFRYTARK